MIIMYFISFIKFTNDQFYSIWNDSVKQKNFTKRDSKQLLRDNKGV
jgi:hypothetical protein